MPQIDDFLKPTEWKKTETDQIGSICDRSEDHHQQLKFGGSPKFDSPFKCDLKTALNDTFELKSVNFPTFAKPVLQKPSIQVKNGVSIQSNFKKMNIKNHI